MSKSAHISAEKKRLRKRLGLILAVGIVLFVSVPVVLTAAVAPASALEMVNVAEVTATTQAVAVVVATPTTAPTVSTTETTAPAGPQVDYSAEELEFVQLLNEYRESKGLEALLLSDTLTVACEIHTTDMVTYDFLNHFTGYYRASNGRDLPLDGTRSEHFATGANPADRMKACGYDYDTIMGENLAAGQATAAKALAALKASPTHDANLLSDRFKVIGIALVHDDGSDWGYYWTTDFGGYVDDTAHAAATAVASLN